MGEFFFILFVIFPILMLLSVQAEKKLKETEAEKAVRLAEERAQKEYEREALNKNVEERQQQVNSIPKEQQRYAGWSINKKIEEIKEQKRRAEEALNKKIEEFEKSIGEIPVAELKLDLNYVLKRKTMDTMPIVKFSNITRRSSIYSLCDFVVIDLETTGIALNRSKIVELSAVRFQDFEPIEIFSTLINPQKPIPEDATAVNGITDDMVKDAPTLSQVAQQFIDFVGKSTVVGHNVLFDLRHLYHNGIDLSDNKKYCTYTLAKKVVKRSDVRNYKLTSLCDYFNILVSTAHRASYDCIYTGYLFERLCREILY